jgi:hypothetical protein
LPLAGPLAAAEASSAAADAAAASRELATLVLFVNVMLGTAVPVYIYVVSEHRQRATYIRAKAALMPAAARLADTMGRGFLPEYGLPTLALVASMPLMCRALQAMLDAWCNPNTS